MRVLLILALLLASCGPANQAYLDRDWDKFVESCEEMCPAGESDPQRIQAPHGEMWVCGCVDEWEEEYF